MKAKYEERYTFSSEVLLRKHRNASENWEPQEPVRKSAMQGHSRAFWAISSTDWKFQNFKLFSFTQLAKLKVKDECKPQCVGFHILQLLQQRKKQHNMRFRFSQTFIQTLEAHEKWNTKKQPARTDSREMGLEVSLVVVWVSVTASALSVWPILNPDF